MPYPIGTLRRLALAPSLRSVSFAGRGFPVEPTPATARLETIPQSVVCGFEWGIEEGREADLERRLGMIEPELRGFAYKPPHAFSERYAAMGANLAEPAQLLPGEANDEPLRLA